MKACVPCRDADAGLVSAPRGVTGEALQAPQGTDGLLRLAAVRPGEKIRDPAVSVHAGESGAGHGAQSVRDAGASTHARTRHTPAAHKNKDARLNFFKWLLWSPKAYKNWSSLYRINENSFENSLPPCRLLNFLTFACNWRTKNVPGANVTTRWRNIWGTVVVFLPRAGKNVVPEPADEAQEAAEEGAGWAEDPRGAGEDHGRVQRERADADGQERGWAESPRPRAGLIHAGRPRRRRGRRRGHRGRHLLPGPSTIVGGRVVL